MSWFSGGLKFECTQCGNCCTGAPGYVWITIEELYRIAEFLGMRDREFVQRYVRKIDQRMSLIELPNGNCIFYDRGCKIYPVRPSQCRIFPFWKEILDNQTNWEKAAKECPGMNHGKKFSKEEIDALLQEP
jgi:Fe-S-cluster containining protein